jgi:hypothetical protein
MKLSVPERWKISWLSEEDGIEMDVTEAGREGVEWIHLAQDRDR